MTLDTGRIATGDQAAEKNGDPSSGVPAAFRDEDGELPLGRGERILVVDDEPTFGRVVARLLRILCYEAEWVGNPLEALRVFDANPRQFQAVLLDFCMPKMTGLEFAEKVRALPSGVPIVMMSGFSEPLDLGQLERLQIKSLLQKPLTQETIAQALRQALERESSLV